MYYTQPRFEAKDYEVGLKQLQAVLPNMMTNPDFIYQIELQKAIYGDSPRRPSVSLEWLGQLNIESIKKAYTMLMADNAALKVYITGNVNMETLKPLVEKYIGSLPILTKKGTAWEDENISKPKGKVDKELKVKMQTPKTTVGIIYTGTMAKTMENNIKMSLLNGVMDQLYTKTIREDEGGTYGVGVMGAVTGEPKEEFMLLINFDTDVTKAVKLISLAKEGLKGIAQNGPNAEYLAKTKENLIKGFPEKQINNSYWHSLVYNYYSYNRDNHTNYIETVNKVATVESIQKFVQEILSQGNELNLIMNPAQ
jgi:zinc protease